MEVPPLALLADILANQSSALRVPFHSTLGLGVWEFHTSRSKGDFLGNQSSPLPVSFHRTLGSGVGGFQTSRPKGHFLEK